MESLREVLWNKHQRRRLPLKQMEQIDAMLGEMREEAKTAEGEPDGRE
jgi:hypothetical protein